MLIMDVIEVNITFDYKITFINNFTIVSTSNRVELSPVRAPIRAFFENENNRSFMMDYVNDITIDNEAIRIKISAAARDAIVYHLCALIATCF